jgi:FlaA1/EpsC-like NDP-sugar epimerase
MEELLIRHRRVLIIATHAAVFAVSLPLAFALRFDLTIPAPQQSALLMALGIFVAAKLAVFAVMRQYAGWWRYASIDDVLNIIKASLAGLVVCGALVYVLGLRYFPRSVILLDSAVTMFLLSAVRLAVRMFRERLVDRNRTSSVESRRTLVVGTGQNAEALVREAGRTQSLGLHVVGLVATDARYVGLVFGAVRVVGQVDDLERLIADFSVQQVVIALEQGDAEGVRRVVTVCSSSDVPYRVLPSTEDLVQGRVTTSRIREVSLQDLLGRQPVRLRTQMLADLINGQTVMVTGAGGSIGSELCRQLAGFGAGQIVLLEQAENPLFHLERELLQDYPDVRLIPVVADVYDRERLDTVLAQYEPSIVLHAAAHKHVPLMEQNPSEAIKNNIIGTLNVVAAAQKAGVARFILISTDKAVNPTSVMGASKRIAEMLVQALNETGPTKLAAVRFGNVLGSNGSVIPIFQKQIEQGGPVTVTHPEMRRYFMTIPEATQLVLQSAAFAAGGEIFVLDMGEPVYIVDVARDLIRLSGLRPDIDIDVVFSGMRPGEKLFEELSTDQEVTEATAHERVFKCLMSPLDAPRVEAAARALEGFAQQGVGASQLRRRIFDTLHELEGASTKPASDMAPAPNVVSIKNSRSASSHP